MPRKKVRSTEASRKELIPFETKQFCVRYAHEVGVEKVAREFGFTNNQVEKWCREIDPTPGASKLTSRNVFNMSGVDGAIERTTLKSKRVMTREMKANKTLRRFYDIEGRDMKEELQFHLDTLKRLRKCQTVDLHDMNDVVKRTEDYFSACFEAGVMPSVMGLSTRAYGLRWEMLEKYLDKHHDEICEYIQTVKGVIADVITDNAYKDTKSIVMSIFQLKNHYNHADKVEIKQTTEYTEERSIEDITQRYLDKGVVLEPMKEITGEDESEDEDID